MLIFSSLLYHFIRKWLLTYWQCLFFSPSSFGNSSSELVTSYSRHLEMKHDMLLSLLFEHGTYKKLYSYRHLINGFAVHISPEQVKPWAILLFLFIYIYIYRYIFNCLQQFSVLIDITIFAFSFSNESHYISRQKSLDRPQV